MIVLLKKERGKSKNYYLKKDLHLNCKIMGYSDMNLECFRPPTLLKKEILAQVFPCEFCEISKNTFFTEHLRWLLLECGFY